MTMLSIRPGDPTLSDSVDDPLAPLALTPAERAEILACARSAIAAAARASWPSALGATLDEGGSIDLTAAVFVTLTQDGRLRGCMGSLDPDLPILRAVIGAAIAAAIRDPRFVPVRAEELPTIHVDVSVLGPASAIHGPGAFRPGVDGVLVERGWQRALLLPEVATELGWDASAMFGAVCRKAGLSSDAWRHPDARLSTFRTVRFGGPAIEVPDTA